MYLYFFPKHQDIDYIYLKSLSYYMALLILALVTPYSLS